MDSISFIVFILSFVLYSRCEVLRDPHDMFEIFKDQTISTLSEKEPQQMDNKSGPEPSSCQHIHRSKSCSNLLDTLLQSLDQLFPKEEDDRDYDISLRISLTSNEIHLLKHRISQSTSEDELCTTLHSSIKREPLRTFSWNLFYNLKDLAKWALDLFYELKYQIRFNIHIDLKDYVVYLWMMTFISCLYILVVLRSAVLTLGWILLCVIFISTYTTYQHKYQIAVTEREALLMPYKLKGMPTECSNPKKGYLAEKYEFFFGAGPVEPSYACKEFFKKMHISPDVEVKISDALAETIFGFFSKIMNAIFVAADDVAGQLSAKQSYFFQTTVYWFVYGLVLLFGLCILLFYSGGDISFFGLRIHQSRTTTPLQMPHRQCVETVPTLPHAPQVPQVHTHIHLPLNMGLAQQPNLTNQNQENPERLYWHAGVEQSSITNLIHRRPYRKLKSVQFLKQSTLTERNDNRRSSF